MPAGSVSAWNSGRASLPTLVPGACCGGFGENTSLARETEYLHLWWLGVLTERFEHGFRLKHS